MTVPSKGYRKGISDTKVPLPRQVYFRTTDAAYEALLEESSIRSIPVSELTRIVVESHLRRQRAELPHRQENAAALRELCRLGNNINQIAKQANLMNLHLIEGESRRALAAVMEAVRRL